MTCRRLGYSHVADVQILVNTWANSNEIPWLESSYHPTCSCLSILFLDWMPTYIKSSGGCTGLSLHSFIPHHATGARSSTSEVCIQPNISITRQPIVGGIQFRALALFMHTDQGTWPRTSTGLRGILPRSDVSCEHHLQATDTDN